MNLIVRFMKIKRRKDFLTIQVICAVMNILFVY